MIQFTCLVRRFSRKVYPQTTEYATVNLRKNYARMHFAIAKHGEFFHSNFRIVIGKSTNGKSHENFICMQTRIRMAKMLCFQVLNRFNNHRGKQFDFIRNASQMLQCIQKRC